MCTVDSIDKLVWCRGRNWDGRLGLGNLLFYTSGLVPLTNCTDTSAGAYTSCWVCNSDLYCAGDSLNYALNLPANGTKYVNPVKVVQGGVLSSANSLSDSNGNQAHSRCILKVDQSLHCVGVDNGLFTTASNPHLTTYTQIAPSVVSFGLGWLYMCYISIHGALFCRGQNTYMQFGLENTGLYETFLHLENGVAHVITAFSHICFVYTAGGVRCAGRQTDGALGDGVVTNTNRSAFISPTNMGFTLGITGVAGYSASSCFLFDTNQVGCFGPNYNGIFANGNTDPWINGVILAYQSLGSVITDIAIGTSATCVITISRQAFCAGLNRDGMFAASNIDGTFTSPEQFPNYPLTDVPTPLPTQSPIITPTHSPSNQAPTSSPTENLALNDTQVLGYEDEVLPIPLASLFVQRPNRPLFELITAPLFGSIGYTQHQLFPSNETLLYHPNPDWFGNDSFSIAIEGSEFIATVFVTILPVNDPPSLSEQPTVTLFSNTTVTIPLSVIDIDSTSHNITLTEVSNNIYVTANQTDITVQSTNDAQSMAWFTFDLMDEEGAATPYNISVQVLFSVTVCLDSCTTTLSEDAQITIILASSDVLNRNSTTFEILQQPAKAVISPTNIPYLFTLTPNPNAVGNDSFLFRARVGASIGPIELYSFSILSILDEPTVTFDAIVQVCDESLTPVPFTINDVDNDEFEVGLKIQISSPQYGGTLVLPHLSGLVYDRCAGLSQFGICTSVWVTGPPTLLNQALAGLQFKCTQPDMVTGNNGLDVYLYSSTDPIVFQDLTPRFTASIEFSTPNERSTAAIFGSLLAMWIIIGGVSGALGLGCCALTCGIFVCARVTTIGIRADRVLKNLDKPSQ